MYESLEEMYKSLENRMKMNEEIRKNNLKDLMNKQHEYEEKVKKLILKK